MSNRDNQNKRDAGQTQQKENRENSQQNQNKAQKPGYAAALRHAFESAGVKVLEAAELGPSPYTSPYIP